MKSRRFWFWLGFFLVVAGSIHGHCQVLCIEPPLQAVPDPALQLQVQRLFTAKGYRTNCDRYDYEVTFYYLGGVGAIPGEFDYTVTHAEASNIAIGTVVISQPATLYGAWTMVVRRPNEISSLVRIHNGTLKGAVKHIVKSMHKFHLTGD